MTTMWKGHPNKLWCAYECGVSCIMDEVLLEDIWSTSTR